MGNLCTSTTSHWSQFNRISSMSLWFSIIDKGIDGGVGVGVGIFSSFIMLMLFSIELLALSTAFMVILLFPFVRLIVQEFVQDLKFPLLFLHS